MEVPSSPEIKKLLTVRPAENALGIRPPSFKVWQDGLQKGTIRVPRFYQDGVIPPSGSEGSPANISFTGNLREHQVEAVRKGTEVGNGVLSLDVGLGKCLGRDTPILMHDGTIKMVQDIVRGELLMGDDSGPRCVLSTCTGQEMMYRVVPVKGEPYVVNESHILSLKKSTNKKHQNGQVVDICVRDYLKMPPGPRADLKGWRAPVIFSSREVPLDPYMLGYWLGDGSSRGAVISSQESPVLHYFYKNLGKYGLYLKYTSQYDYRIVDSKRPNFFFKTLRVLNLIQNKHIPEIYKCNSRDIQLQVLAGLIDSDGSLVAGGAGWEITQKNEKLFDDLLYLCRSLGFACYKQKCEKTCTNAPGGPKKGTYFRCSISGEGVEQVPCKVMRKKAEPRTQKKNVLLTGIKLEPLGIDDYFGFEIDGNRRFLLGDFTVTHNTVCALALAAQFKRRTLIIVHKGFLADQWIERIQQFCPGATIGRVQQDEFSIGNDFVIAMIQTLCQRPFAPGAFKSFGTLIVDEAHHIAAQAFSQAMFLMAPKYTLGLTATPERKDGLTRLLYWFMGPEFFRLARTQQTQVTAKRVPFTCKEFLEAPPVTRFGKMDFSGVVTKLTQIPERNKLLKEIILKSTGRHILVLTDRREHAFWLKENLKDSALYIGGLEQKALDEAAKARIVIGTFSLAQEGLDIPTLDTVFLVTPHSDVKQAIGRILRGASRPVIWDVVDSWSVLYSMWRKRLATYRELGIVVEGEEKAAEVVKGKCLI
jgi:Type III restriction enzyme, res subunit/Hom_end-associated Hint